MKFMLQARYRLKLEAEVHSLHERLKSLELEKEEKAKVIFQLKKECHFLKGHLQSENVEDGDGHIPYDKYDENDDDKSAPSSSNELVVSVDEKRTEADQEPDTEPRDALIDELMEKNRLLEGELNRFRLQNISLEQQATDQVDCILHLRNEVQQISEENKCLRDEMESLRLKIIHTLPDATTLLDVTAHIEEVTNVEEVFRSIENTEDIQNISSIPFDQDIDGESFETESHSFGTTEAQIIELTSKVNELENVIAEQREEMFVLIENTTKSMKAAFDDTGRLGGSFRVRQHVFDAFTSVGRFGSGAVANMQFRGRGGRIIGRGRGGGNYNSFSKSVDNDRNQDIPPI
jgi:hypothetical protein